MFCTLDQAAQRAGLRSSALLEAIASGQIAASKDLFGEWQIEADALERLGAPLAESPGAEGARGPAAPGLLSLEAEIGALIREAGESLRGEPDGGSSDGAPIAQPGQAGPADAGAPAPPSEIDLRLTESVHARAAWNPELTVDGRQRIAPPGSHQRIRVAIIAISILGALGVGWMAGFGSALFYGPKAPTASENRRQNLEGRPVMRSGGRIAVRVPTVSLHRPAPAHGPVPRSVAIRSSAASQQVTGSLGPASPSTRHEPEMPLTPFPDTRPATIEGWFVRNVVGGTVILDGPTGTWRAVQGDAVPGVGRVESIVRWGDRWIVATSGGLISTP